MPSNREDDARVFKARRVKKYAVEPLAWSLLRGILYEMQLIEKPLVTQAGPPFLCP